MKNHGLLIVLIFLMSILGSAQQKKTRSMTGSASKGPTSAGLKVAPDLDKRLAKFRRVRMPFNRTGLTVREQKLVRKLVEACGSGEHFLAAERSGGVGALSVTGLGEEPTRYQASHVSEDQRFAIRPDRRK